MQLPENGHPVSYHDDEIDLFELAGKLYKQKLLILSIAALITIAAVAIALMLPKSYTTEAVINTPSKGALNTWNSRISLLEQISGRSDGQGLIGKLYIDREESYRDFQRFLTSPSTKRAAFEQSALFKAPADDGTAADKKNIEGRYRAFLNNLSISTAKKGTRTTVSYTSSTPEESAHIINEHLIPNAEQQYIDSLKASYVASIETTKKKLLLEIRSKESRFKAANEQRLAELREALSSAVAGGTKELGITEVTPTLLNNAKYLLGSKILKSRIETTKDHLERYRFYSSDKHSNDSKKPYIVGVDSLVFKLQQLNQLNVDFDLQPYTLEQAAPIPVSPSKPKKTLIVAIGTILGLMLSVFVALLKIAIQGRKVRLEQAEEMQKLMADPA